MLATTKKEWHTSLFDELGQYWAEIADARSTEEEAEFVKGVLEARGLVLDLCCGTGRHSVLLCKKGLNMIGLDISPTLLKIAKERMAERGVHFPLVRGEIQCFPFRAETFSAVISMFTSFGYLPSEEEDMISLREVARTLKQGGSLLIDIANREHLIQTFKKKDWGEFPSFYMLERRTLHAEGSRLHSQWILLDKKSGKTRTFEHNLRLYSLSQLQKMLKQVGLTTVKVYGEYEGQEFRQDSLRLIALAKKL